MHSPKASDFANLQFLVILAALLILIACTLLMQPLALRAAFAGDPATVGSEPIVLTK